MKNITMKVAGLLLASLLAPMTANAAGGNVKLQDVDIDVHNQASLQRGAKYYANHCQGCHSLEFSRYNRVAKDIGLTDEQVKDNLIFTRGENGERHKVGELMVSAISTKDAEGWFGAPPPDLSLVGRSRGADWIYSYLNAFYLDPSRPMGVNNLVFDNVGMPHVLGELQGWKALKKHDDEHAADDAQAKDAKAADAEHAADDANAKEGDDHAEKKKHDKADKHHEPELVMVKAGTMSPAEYDQLTRDLTAYLVYVSEPAQLHRKKIGVYVLLFLALLFVFAYFLKKEYWKDIH